MFVAYMLMLLPLQSAVTACDCDFTATISIEDTQGEILTGIVNSDGSVDIIEDES